MVHALRAIHAALVPGGVVVDTQPVSARPVVESDAGKLGTLDMREWAALIRGIDNRVGEAVAAGLFAVEDESRFVVTDGYDDGDEFLEHTSTWVGTRIPRGLERRAARERSSVRVHQVVRMRLLRAGP